MNTDRMSKYITRSKYFLFAILLLMLTTDPSIINAITKLVRYENYRGLELFFLGVPAVILAPLATYEYVTRSHRQRRTDLSSVSINIKEGDAGRSGIFVITNNGEIPQHVIIEKAILNTGITESEDEDINPQYHLVFTGLINPKQTIDFHSFHIEVENIYMFKGILRLTTTAQDIKQQLLVKVRYAGSQSIIEEHLRAVTSPHLSWIIYSQNQYSER